LLQNGILHI